MALSEAEKKKLGRMGGILFGDRKDETWRLLLGITKENYTEVR